MKRADEMEQSLANKSEIITFVFYAVSLFLYSVYLYSSNGELGIPFIIFTIGMIIFFISNFIFKQKMK
jgi:nitrate reductase NapE component